MRRRSIPPLVPTLVVTGLLGLWAGTGFGAVSLPPTMSLPTVTVPTVTVAIPPTPATPLPPPPTVTVTPSKVSPPPLPEPPKPPVSVPAVPAVPPPVVPSPAPAPPPAASGPDGAGGASSRPFILRERRQAAQAARAPSTARETRPAGRSTPISDATLAPHRPIREEGSPRLTFGALEAASGAIPSALFAMAALAVLLLALASMPQPVAGSRAGAMLVHKRGSIAVAGLAALAMAVATYLLL
jgi:hypothetical protein